MSSEQPASKKLKAAPSKAVPATTVTPASGGGSEKSDHKHKSPSKQKAPPLKLTEKGATTTVSEKKDKGGEGNWVCPGCNGLVSNNILVCPKGQCKTKKPDKIPDWICSECKETNSGKAVNCPVCGHGRMSWPIDPLPSQNGSTKSKTAVPAPATSAAASAASSSSSAAASSAGFSNLSDDMDLMNVDLSNAALTRLQESQARDRQLIQSSARNETEVSLLNMDTTKPVFSYKFNGIAGSDSKHFSMSYPGIRGHMKFWTAPFRLGPSSRVNHYGNYKGTKEAANDKFPATNLAKAQYIFEGTMAPINMEDLNLKQMQSGEGFRMKTKWKELSKRGHSWAARNIPTVETAYKHITTEMTREGKEDDNGDYTQGGKIFEQNRINAQKGKPAITEQKREEMLMEELLKNHVSCVYVGKDGDNKKYIDDNGDRFYIKAHVFCHPFATKDTPQGKYLSPVIEEHETKDKVWTAMIKHKKIKPVNFKWWDAAGKLIPPDKRIMDVSKGPIVKLLVHVGFKKPEPNAEDSSGAGLPGFMWMGHEMQILRDESELITLAPPPSAALGGDEFKPAEDRSLQICGQSEEQERALLDMIADPSYTGKERVLDMADKVNKAVPPPTSSSSSSSSAASAASAASK